MVEFFMAERKLLDDFEKEFKDVGYFKDAK
jgi:hypothetical protein